MKEWAVNLLADWRDVLGALLPVVLLAALGGVVRAMQCGKSGLKAVCMAATTAGFVGLLVWLLLSETGLPQGVQVFLVGVSGYASGELLKIFVARVCRRLESMIPK